METAQGIDWRGGKAPGLIGIPPRSVYGDCTEADAIRLSLLAARGRTRPVWCFGNRRILGVTQGRDVFSDEVRFFPFRQQYRFGWTDANDMINEISNNGKFGRTYWSKTPTTTGVANNWYDLWPVTGNPTAGAVNGTAFTANSWTDASTGAINHRGNVSTDTKHLLSKWAVLTANTPLLMLYDRVISYDQCSHTNTANQALTNTNTAQRYNSGAPGLLPVIVACTLQGATAANLTQFRYTNQAGTTLQAMPTTPTVTFIPSVTAPTTTLGARVCAPITSGQTVPWGFHLPLANGDTGCSLVHDYTTSSANTGTFTIVLMHPLTDLIVPIAGVPTEMDCVFQMTELERIYDGACLAVMSLQPLTTGNTATGCWRYGWG